jgi:hypothetical protein
VLTILVPTLDISLLETTNVPPVLLLQWFDDFKLQSATNLGLPGLSNTKWTTIFTNVFPLTNNSFKTNVVTEPSRYFRLIRPDRSS